MGCLGSPSLGSNGKNDHSLLIRIPYIIPLHRVLTMAHRFLFGTCTHRCIFPCNSACLLSRRAQASNNTAPHTSLAAVGECRKEAGQNVADVDPWLEASMAHAIATSNLQGFCRRWRLDCRDVSLRLGGGCRYQTPTI